MQPNVNPAQPLLTPRHEGHPAGVDERHADGRGDILSEEINGMRAGNNAFLTGWLLLATLCFFPTFVITNKVFLMGGRMSLFVPVTAATYVLTMLTGRFYFGEVVSWTKWAGCGLIIAGVAAIARG